MKNILISVTNKALLDNLLISLNELNCNIYASSGTGNYIKNKGYKVNFIEDYIDFPHILDGRVKTLHPKIYGGILNDKNNSKHNEELLKHKIVNFDLILVDLYPFKEALKSKDHKIINENIDIGGVTLIRAAVKGHIPIVIEEEDYTLILKELKNGISQETINYLKCKALYHVYKYDEEILYYFLQNSNFKLRYGENPNQKAYTFLDSNIKILKGELSYNNILDLSASSELCSVLEKYYKHVAVIVKHTSPSGVGVSDISIDDAFNKAWDLDSLSNFGGILAVSSISTSLINNFKNKFIELISAKSISSEFIVQASSRTKLKIVEYKNTLDTDFEVKKVFKNSTLFQDYNKWWDFSIEDFKTVTNKKPTHYEGLSLAWSIASLAKSNAVVISDGAKVLGIGSGSVSRLDAAILALSRAKQFINNKKNLTLNNIIVASDGFFPFYDSIDLINKELKINTIIQPGGSIRDEDLLDYCNKYDISMLFTSIRTFKH